jgi:putative Holliday junction resolvase
MSSAISRGRLLGIDHGSKVIGLAVCDVNWTVARPLQLLVRKTRAADFAEINKVIANQEIAAIVVGLPELPAEIVATSQASTVRRWASRLAAAVSIPVYLWDEQFSTSQAEQLAAEAGKTGSGRLDDWAAAAILQSFIEAHPPGAILPNPI